MRIKTYTASSVPLAMDEIRKDFGARAVILSNQRTYDGVRITVGLEDEQTEDMLHEALYGSADEQTLGRLQKALEAQSVPALLIERILSATDANDANNDVRLLSGAFSRVFRFAPLPQEPSKRAFMLVGASGSGKTIAVAKMAVKAKLTGKKIAVITTDIKRAGAIEQLEAFTKILELNLIKVRKPDLLKSAIEVERTHKDLILIDTPGVNPFLSQDIALLSEMKADTEGIEPVLVMSAGQDAFEAAEMAEAFLPLGVARVMGTRLDLSRRVGNILYAAQSNGYALTDVGISAHVSEGLCPLKSTSLAELILLTRKKEVVL